MVNAHGTKYVPPPLAKEVKTCENTVTIQSMPSPLGDTSVLILQGFNRLAVPDDIDLQVATEVTDHCRDPFPAVVFSPVRKACVRYSFFDLRREPSVCRCLRTLRCRVPAPGQTELAVAYADEDKENRYEKKRREIRPFRCGRRDFLSPAEGLAAPGTAYCIGFICSAALRTIQDQFSTGSLRGTTWLFLQNPCHIYKT